MADLAELELDSAHELTGNGLGTTWPNGELTMLPIRLDHVHVSKNVVVLRLDTGDGDRSDHKPLIADVALTEGASKTSK
jgi:endonuclease/exonuclease/phosphatase (EEP) superfamily protein YafD